MKKLPIGIQTFRTIVEGDYVYADKTEYVYKLAQNAKYYFLSRPRRFGKSLLLDTIAEAFNGEKELFKGLWIYNSDHDFKKHPIIRLDMSNISAKTPDELEESIMMTLQVRISSEGFDIQQGIPSFMFKRLIELLHEKYNERVVVLIDEYDKPILDNITDVETAETNRRFLKGFYGILKSMDSHLRFTMLTGVSKFAKTSVFSELNNLLDITMMGDYANICGITAEDLDKHFNEHIATLSEEESLRHYGDIRSAILNWYDGYSWDGKSRVLNPISLLSFIAQKRFMGYWYASGTPKFLIDLIKKNPEAYTNISNLEINELMLDSSDLENIAIEPLLFQSGYLTVKKALPTMGLPAYLLDMPNMEVKETFNMHIVSSLTESGDVKTRQFSNEINKAFTDGDLKRALSVLRRLFGRIPYEIHVNNEAYYHSIIYALLTFTGIGISAEVSVSDGRVDAVLEYNDKVYVMEFKYKDVPRDISSEEKKKVFNQTLTEGMNQIDEKGYCKPYVGGGKAVYKVALAFLGRSDIEMEYEIC